MYEELFEIRLEDLTLKVQYDESTNYFLCDFNDGEQQHIVSQHDQGSWYEVNEGYTTMACQLGKIIEAKVQVKVS
ncbi:MAG: hypothetical protein JST75_06780 [Bacteroidetes bacterium]|nr:hypothetical protein [Bacteroidota bacterium]